VKSNLLASRVSKNGKMSRKGLMEQDLRKLDVTQLYPLLPEIISRQATINIGMFIHMEFSTFLLANNGYLTMTCYLFREFTHALKSLYSLI
jgi:hypothetical protein